jgi:hypothetical protein
MTWAVWAAMVANFVCAAVMLYRGTTTDLLIGGANLCTALYMLYSLLKDRQAR